MKRRVAWLTVVLALASLAPASAGFKLLDADGKEKIDLGFRLQVLGKFTEGDLDGDGSFESVDDFQIRRARFRLTGTVNEHFGMFFQTDVSGNDIVMIDAYIQLKKSAKLQAFIGQHLAPSSRQTITSSGALLAMDRPGLIYKALTWGGRALTTFDTATYGDSAAGFSGPAQVRDTGFTLFGINSSSSGKTHFKWYLGTYDGLPAAGTDGERTTGRLQVNFGDSEPSYYSTASYLGKKDTFSIGVSYDTQSDVAGSSTPKTDYSYWNVDVFAEQPMGAGSVSFEAAYHDLDLDGANPQAEGNGYYVQAGYLVNKDKWQPWFLYEDWSADAASGKGSYNLWRAGISYFMAGHNANIKVGYEAFSADANIGSTNEDSIGSLVVGFYTTY
ncbi:MAG: OprO/OprP family phosphate-selective porin [Acidobacteriota bacterium]|nr:OprO/OprP family phosphate-selective porin [Acidobacteriota bacterium]